MTAPEKKIRITIHGRRRAVKRMIKLGHIRRAITKPHIRYCQPEGRVRAEKVIDKKRLVVIYALNQTSSPPVYVVLTAYYTLKPLRSGAGAPSRLRRRRGEGDDRGHCPYAGPRRTCGQADSRCLR